MEVAVKKTNPHAYMPQYASKGAACFDLHACIPNSAHSIHPGDRLMVGTGLAFEVPEGYAMLIYSRSGLGAKHGVRLANSVGVIDSDYRGEVQLPMINDGQMPFSVDHGDRLAQAMIIPVPAVWLHEVQELSSTERGAGGFGSTGVAA